MRASIWGCAIPVVLVSILNFSLPQADIEQNYAAFSGIAGAALGFSLFTLLLTEVYHLALSDILFPPRNEKSKDPQESVPMVETANQIASTGLDIDC